MPCPEATLERDGVPLVVTWHPSAALRVPSKEELVIFDILTRPAPELTTEERAEVKKVAKELLARLRRLLVLNWRQKSAARSRLKLAIEDALDNGLPRAYSPELYQEKCSAVFEHLYETYPDARAGNA